MKMSEKYYVQWMTERVHTTDNQNYEIKIVGWCVRQKHQIGFIAEVDTQEKAEALAKLLNSQADIEERP